MKIPMTKQAMKEQETLESNCTFYRNLPTSTTHAITDRRLKMLHKIMNSLDAYDPIHELYKVNELFALHHPGHLRPFARSPEDGKRTYQMNYDTNSRYEKARTQLHTLGEHRFDHNIEFTDNHSRLILYISWPNFLECVYTMFPGEEFDLERLTSSLHPSKRYVRSFDQDPQLVCPYDDGFESDDPLPSFDLHHVQNQPYRIFYLQRDPRMRQVIEKGQVWFCVSDLFRVYSGKRYNTQEDADQMYLLFKLKCQSSLDLVRQQGKLRGLKEDGNEEEYIQSATFDTEFLRCIPTRFAQAIVEALYPAATFILPTNTEGTRSHAAETRPERIKPTLNAKRIEKFQLESLSSCEDNDNEDNDSIALSDLSEPPQQMDATFLADDRVGNSVLFVPILETFKSHVEDHGIVGFYTEQNKPVLYNLYTLTQLVFHTMQMDPIKDRWRKAMSSVMTTLKARRIIHESKEKQSKPYISLGHFLLFCLSFGTENPVTPSEKTWKERVEEACTGMSDEQKEILVPIYDNDWNLMSTEIQQPNNADVFNATTVGQHVTDKLWLRRNLALEASRQGFPRRVFGGIDDLYNIKHLACIAGPYGDVTKAKTALTETSFTLKKSRPCGYVAQQTETYVSRDCFIANVWSHLSNVTKKQTIADTFAAGNHCTANLTRDGSTLLGSVLESNQQKIINEGDEEEIRETDRSRATQEETFAEQHLPENDPLRQARTVPMSKASTVNFNESFELKKFEIETNARERGTTERHKITVDADVQKHAINAKEETERVARTAEAKAKEVEALEKTKQINTKEETERVARIAEAKEETERVARVAEAKAKEVEALEKTKQINTKEETERVARIAEAKEETERVARVTEAKAKDSEAKRDSLRERELTARKTQEVKLALADPTARKAEADADAFEAKARIAEAEANKVRDQIKLAEAINNRSKHNISPPVHPQEPKRSKVKKNLTPQEDNDDDDEEDKENVILDAYIPRTFAPPKYSETYNRPRRGVTQV